MSFIFGYRDSSLSVGGTSRSRIVTGRLGVDRAYRWTDRSHGGERGSTMIEVGVTGGRMGRKGESVLVVVINILSNTPKKKKTRTKRVSLYSRQFISD